MAKSASSHLWLAVAVVTVTWNLSGQTPAAVPPATLGTWTLSVQKSHWSGSIRPSKSETHTWWLKDGRLHITTDRVSSDGRATHSEWIGMVDGKDYPNE